MDDNEVEEGISYFSKIILEYADKISKELGYKK